MQIPLSTTFRGMEPSSFVEKAIEKNAARLERFHPHITRCHVTVEAPHHHHRKGVVYAVRIDLTVPGAEVVVSREPEHDHSHEDVYVALRDAFHATTRRLEDVLRRPRGERHPHEPRPMGRVVRMKPEEGFGFLAMDDGLEVYFHRNSVLHHEFDDLNPGDRVRVVVAETESKRGPQASTVELVSHT